jgi:hypothetical protein
MTNASPDRDESSFTQRRHSPSSSFTQLSIARHSVKRWAVVQAADTESASTYEQYRAHGVRNIHRRAHLIFTLWLVAFVFLYRGELRLDGTLWPAVFKCKVTMYVCLNVLHSAMWFSLDESKARYVFGYLGSLQFDTAHVLLSVLVTLTLSLDDLRLVRLLDAKESYASQMAKSFALTPSRQLPTCGGYVPDGGGCYFNNLEASLIMLLLAHMSYMGLCRVSPSVWWKLMHFSCAWYALCLCSLGHMFSSTTLMLQNVSYLYGALLTCHEGLKRQDVLARSNFLHWQSSRLENHRLIAAAEDAKRANQLINHTCKRVMTNTAQACELALAKLATIRGAGGEEGAGGTGGAGGAGGPDSVENVLRVTRDGAIFGFHMCRAVLLQVSLLSGRYEPQLVEFEACSAAQRSRLPVATSVFTSGSPRLTPVLLPRGAGSLDL